MKKYNAGDKSRAICSKCGLEDTTFQYRDLLLSEQNMMVHNILVGVCDGCGDTVSTPSQSTPQIQEALRSVREIKEDDTISHETAAFLRERFAPKDPSKTVWFGDDSQGGFPTFRNSST